MHIGARLSAAAKRVRASLAAFHCPHIRRLGFAVGEMSGSVGEHGALDWGQSSFKRTDCTAVRLAGAGPVSKTGSFRVTPSSAEAFGLSLAHAVTHTAWRDGGASCAYNQLTREVDLFEGGGKSDSSTVLALLARDTKNSISASWLSRSASSRSSLSLGTTSCPAALLHSRPCVSLNELLSPLVLCYRRYKA